MFPSTNLDPLLTAKDLSRLLQRKQKTILKDRLEGRGPRFIKIGRSVRYRLADVIAYIESCPGGGPEPASGK